MAEIKTKVSLYFPKDLFKKFEKLREENEGKLGVTISKNEFALKLIADAIDNKDSEPSGKVERAIVADELLKFFRTDEGQALVKKFVNEKILKKEDSE